MKIEMHIHTAETSPCANVRAEKMIEEYVKAGYGGVVVTDHFNDDVVECFEGNEEERVTRYLKGFDRAREAGEKAGIQVLFGIETRLAGPNYEDYLIYGAHPDFLYEYPYLYRMTQKEVYQICEKKGMMLFQAHPNRSINLPQDPAYLHGVEVFNGNPRQNSRNEKTAEWAAKYPHLFLSAGSDYHKLEDIDRGGIITDRDVHSEEELVECLRSGVEIIRV